MTVTIGHATVTKITRDTAYVAIDGTVIRSGYHVAVPGFAGAYKAHHTTRASAYRGAVAMSVMYAKGLAYLAAHPAYPR